MDAVKQTRLLTTLEMKRGERETTRPHQPVRTPSVDFFAPCPKGLESLLADELRALGAEGVRETRAGVAFGGTLATAYRACLWSRLASRVLLPLARFQAPTPEALYAGARTIAWTEHLGVDSTLAVDCSAINSPIAHSHYAALKVKDAIVDQLRTASGARPSVDTETPDVRVNVHLHHSDATISLDLSGNSLHRRGYRADGHTAPLKENLAAAILLRANWPAIARGGGTLVDPMCGSGTLLIEGGLMAGDIAPGLSRSRYGFTRWRGHDAALWHTLVDEAEARRTGGIKHMPRLHGYDGDSRAARAARENLRRAGLADFATVEARTLSDCAAIDAPPGLVIVNPPYGERMGEAGELPALYAELGAVLARCFPGWRAAVFTGRPELGMRLGLRATRKHTLYNGALECQLLHFEVDAAHALKPREPKPVVLGAGAEMFANRLRKDLRHFGRWAARSDIGAYRVYDAELHEYNFAIDIYESDKRYAHVQEYDPPDTVDPQLARQRRREALAVIPTVLEIPNEQVAFKIRRRQKGHAQYEKLDQTGQFHEVREGPARFWVNFTDYLDTGLFLDHRLTRALVGEMARGKRFLNLFGYTGSATVYAALGGAPTTTTVDLSHTYLDWARRNLALNKIGGAHEMIQADVLEWLQQARGRRYDLIFLDPPTFSRSKRMTDTLDIQRDHVALIQGALALLAADGVLLFATNNRRFRLDTNALAGTTIDDITRKTIPKDFERNPRIHQCYRISNAPGAEPRGLQSRQS